MFAFSWPKGGDNFFPLRGILTLLVFSPEEFPLSFSSILYSSDVHCLPKMRWDWLSSESIKNFGVKTVHAMEIRKEAISFMEEWQIKGHSHDEIRFCWSKWKKRKTIYSLIFISKENQIGYFRVASNLSFNARLSAKPLWK